MRRVCLISPRRSISLLLVLVLLIALTPVNAVAVREGKTKITPIDNDENGKPDAYEVDWDGDGNPDEEWSDPDEDGVIDGVAWYDGGDDSRSPRGRIGMKVMVVGLTDGGQMIAIDWDGDGAYDEVWWDFDGDGSVDDTDIYETESKVVDNTKATRFRGVFVGVNNGLDYPEKDVEDLTGKLAEYGASWDSADMNKLKGDAATPAAIEGAINAAKADSKPGDEFLFYFSGHGGGYDKDDGLSGGRIDTNGDETAIRIPESEFGTFDGSRLTTPSAGRIRFYSHDLDGDGTADARTVKKSDGSVQVWTRNATAPPPWRVAGTDSDGDGDVDKDDGGVDMNGDGDKADTVGIDDTLLVAGKQKVTDDQLTQWLSGFPESVTIVVIIDSCYSGSFVPDLANNVRDSAGQPLRPGHLEVITAAPADEPALEMPISNGVLTQGILNALTRLPASVTGGHDTSVGDYIGDQDDRTTTRELFTWAGPSAVTYSNLNNDGDGARNEDGVEHALVTPTSSEADDSLDDVPLAVDDTLGVTHLKVDNDEDGLFDEDPSPMTDSFFDVYYDPDFHGLPTPTFKTAFSGDSELNATGMRPGIGVYSIDELSPGTTETPGATFELEIRQMPGPAVMPSPPGYVLASDVYDVSLDEVEFLPPFEEVTSTVEPMLHREAVEDLISLPGLMMSMTPEIAEGPIAEPWYYDEGLGDWVPLMIDGAPHPETGEVSFHPLHFSAFALMRPEPGPWVSADTTPPLAPWRLSGTASGPDVTLTWSNPTDPDFAGTEVWHSDTTHALSATQTAGMDQLPAFRTPFLTDTGRADGLHYYTAFSFDIPGNWSDAARTVVRVGDPVSTPIEGANRFRTAVQASQQAFPADDSLPLDPEGYKTVVVATGRNWPDALGGSSLAGAVGGPLLLVDTNALPSYVGDEITRLGADRVMLLGGEAAVSSDVYDALEDLSVDVERISGSTRFSTAEKIADRTVELLDTDYEGVALVATGRAFPDALAGSPLAAGKVWPIYLSDTSGLRTSTTDQMTDDGVTDAIVLGGEAAVPAGVITQLEGMLSGDVDRLWGSDRYATAAAIAGFAVDSAGMHWDGVAMATGTDFPDAMSGGVLQGLDGSVVLLTKSTSLSGASRSVLETNGYRIYEVRFLGGEAAISTSVRAAVMTAIE